MENPYYSKNDTISHTPHTRAEEMALFKRFYAGDPKNMSADALEARDIILKNNLRYAAMIALRRSSRRQYHQDLISCANAGLIKALECRRHVPERGRFTTFATKYILGEIRAFFRVSCSVSFPAGRLPDWPKDGGEDPDVETLADPSAFVPAHLDHATLREAIATLPDIERELIELIFLQRMKVRAAADQLGIGRQWATELRDRALEKLRLALGAAASQESTTEEEAI